MYIIWEEKQTFFSLKLLPANNVTKNKKIPHGERPPPTKKIYTQGKKPHQGWF